MSPSLLPMPAASLESRTAERGFRPLFSSQEDAVFDEMADDEDLDQIVDALFPQA